MKTLLFFVLLTFSSVLLANSDFPDNRTEIFGAGEASKLIAAVAYRPPDGITGYWVPSSKEIPAPDAWLKSFLHHSMPGSTWDWAKYGRQAAGIIIGGKKLIFISYFIYDSAFEAAEAKRRLEKTDFESWGTTPYHVFDGGDGYFRVVYDPTKGDYVWREFNGSA